MKSPTTLMDIANTNTSHGSARVSHRVRGAHHHLPPPKGQQSRCVPQHRGRRPLGIAGPKLPCSKSTATNGTAQTIRKPHTGISTVATVAKPRPTSRFISSRSWVPAAAPNAGYSAVSSDKTSKVSPSEMIRQA